jgi:hypothetical protein
MEDMVFYPDFEIAVAVPIAIINTPVTVFVVIC